MSEVWPGRPVPARRRRGTGAARTSRCSPSTPSGVELCLFDDDDNETRVELTERTALNWHCYLPGRRARASATATACTGPYAPREGHRFNPAKLLIDPYAKAIDGVVDWDARRQRRSPTCPTGDEDADLEPDDEDDARARSPSRS